MMMKIDKTTKTVIEIVGKSMPVALAMGLGASLSYSMPQIETFIRQRDSSAFKIGCYVPNGPPPL